MSFAATWMGLEIVMLSEVTQTEKEKYPDTPSMWNLKKNYVMNLLATHTQNADLTEVMVARGKDGGKG